MVDKVVGNIAGVPNPKSDWGQNDERKANYIKNKPDLTVFANALKGTTSGEAIGITDISPIEHNMGVGVRGKNLIPFPYPLTSGIYKDVEVVVNDDGTIVLNGTASGISYLTISNKDFGNKDLYQGGKANGMILSSGNDKDTSLYYNSSNKILSYTITKDKTYDNYIVKPMIEEGTTATSYAPSIEDISTVKLYKLGKNLLSNDVYEKRNWIYEAQGQTYTYNLQLSKGMYTISFDCVQQKGYFYLEYSTDDWETRTTTYLMTPTILKQTHTFEVDEKKQWRLFWYFSSNWFADGYITNIQIELGNSATEYEPYIEPVMYDVPSDGTVEGVKSLYPNTTLYTDTSGAVIDVEYNKDINKAFAELQNAIIAIGGLE